jgi:hypothetical protein
MPRRDGDVFFLGTAMKALLVFLEKAAGARRKPWEKPGL